MTGARRAAEKGEYRLGRADVEREAFDNDATGLFALWLPGAEPEPGEGAWLRNVFGDSAHLAVELHREDDDSASLACLIAMAGGFQLVPTAAGDGHMVPRRQRRRSDEGRVGKELGRWSSTGWAAAH